VPRFLFEKWSPPELQQLFGDELLQERCAKAVIDFLQVYVSLCTYTKTGSGQGYFIILNEIIIMSIVFRERYVLLLAAKQIRRGSCGNLDSSHVNVARVGCAVSNVQN
jgi:hypothetical protein